MITCPNTNDDNWKELVNTVGAIRATQIYANLNGNYPILGKNEDGTDDENYTNLVSEFGKEKAKILWYDKFSIDTHYSVNTDDNSSPYYSTELSLTQQLAIVNTITYNINSELISGTTVKAEEVIKKWKDYYNSLSENEKATEQLKDVINRVNNAWGVISNLVKLKLSSVQGITVKTETIKSDQDKESEEDDGLNDQDTINERINFSDDWSLFIDGKSTMSSNLKRVFSSIRDLNKEGNVQNDFLGTIKIVPFDKVYNSIIPLVSGVKSNFNTMMKELETHIISMPYLRDVIDTLNSSSSQIKNEFVANASSHYVRMQYLGWSKNTVTDEHEITTNSYGMVPSNTNTNDIAYVINNKWKNNLVNSSLLEKLNSNDESLTYNREQVIKILDEINELQSPKDIAKRPDKIKSIFEAIGIKLSPDTITTFLNHGYKHEGTTIKYDKQFSSEKGIFNILTKRLEKIIKEPSTIFQDFNIIDDNVFNTLAKQESKNSLSDFSNSHTRGDNKIVFSYARNKFFIDRINDLKNSEFLRSNLEAISFSSTSEWLKFLKDDTSLGYNNFNYFYVDTLTQFGKTQTPIILAEATPGDHEIYKLGMFTNRGTITGKNERFGRILFPTMSDGTTIFGVNTQLHNTQMVDGKLAPSTIEALYQALVASELKRIIKYKELNKTLYIENYDKGATKFIMLPILNDIFNKTIGNLKTRDTEYSNKELEFKKQANSVIEEYVASIVADKQKDWINFGILQKNKAEEDAGLKTTTIDGVRYTAHFLDKDYIKNILNGVKGTDKIQYTLNDIEVNYLIAKAEFQQLIIGDPALYYKSGKTDIESSELTFDNISKRLAGDRAPGVSLADSDTNKFIQIFAQDRFADTLHKELADIKGYKGIKSTDAQEFTTFKEHLYVMSKLGKIKSEDINQLISKNDKGTLTDQDIELVFQPIKPVDVQHIEDVENDISRRYYVKSSSYPLVKQLTKGLELDKLREKMEELEEKEGKTVRLAFASAVKIGNITNPIELFDNEGRIKDDLDFTDKYSILNRSGFKIQQEVPEGHDTVNIVSQASVLIFNNILNETFKYEGKNIQGKDLQSKYFAKYGEIYKLQYDKLLKDLEWNGSNINIARLKEVFDAEVEGGSFDINAAAGVEIKDSNFTHRLTFNPNIFKYESVLNSIIDSRVRKIKFLGSSFVLSTEEGYKSKGEIKGEEAIKDNPGIIFTKDWKGQLAYNQIILPNRFKDNDGNSIDFQEKNDKGEYIWLKQTKSGYILDESKIDPTLLDILGFRIPNQGHSSMTSPTIVGFLPNSTGDLVIASRDLVVQMGSDFDVDKLYTYFYNHTLTIDKDGNKRLDKYTSKISDNKSLQNDIMDIYKVILRSGNKLVDSLQYKPLDSERIVSLAKEINNTRIDKIGTNPYFTALSSVYDRKVFFDNRDGKSGVATFSALSVLNANLQGKDVVYGKYINTEEGSYFEPKSIVFGKKESTTFSDTNTTEPGITKSDVISWDQSESVDNAKNKRLSKLGLNTDTFNAKLALNLFGFVDEGYWFLNQDIIHDYVDELNKLRGAGSTSFEKDGAFKNIVTKYQELALVNGDDTFTRDSEEEQSKYDDLSGKDLSLEQMKLLVSKEGSTIHNYATIQLAILDKFRDLSNVGLSIKQLTSTTNTNSKGLGVSIMENVLKEEQLARLGASGVFQNADRLIGEYITSEEYNTLGKPNDYFPVRGKDNLMFWVKPNTINGYASIYSILTANAIYKEYFDDYFNTNINTLLNNINLIGNLDTEGSTKNVAKIKQQIFTEFRSYVYSNSQLGISNSPIEDRKRLLYDQWINNKHTHQSLASILNNIQNTKLGILNPFLNKLTFDLNKGNVPSIIKFNSSSTENLDEMNIHLGFIDLLKKDRPIEGMDITTKQLANDIIKYVYLTGGKTNFTSFIKFIPDSYLEELGFNKAIKEYKPSFENVNNLVYHDLHPFVQQYFQHNIDEVTKIKKDDILNGKTVIKDEKLIVNPKSKDKYSVLRQVYNGEGMVQELVAPELLSFKSGQNTQLYKFVTTDEKGNSYKDNNWHYQRISTLGQKGLNEYDEGNKDAHSLIKDNNSKFKLINTVLKSDEVKVESNKKNLISSPSIATKYGFEKDQIFTQEIKNILTKIIDNTESPLNSFVAKEYLKAINKTGVKLTFKQSTSLKSAGRVTGQIENGHQVIEFNSKDINKSNDDFRYTILHELTHTLTLYSAKNTESPEDNTTVRRLRGIYNEVIQTLGEDKVNELKNKLQSQLTSGEQLTTSKEDAMYLYGGISLQEMIALTMNSPAFQKMMNEIQYKGTDRTFWQHILDRLVELFKVIGMDIKEGSALHYAINDIISLVNHEEQFGDNETKIEQESSIKTEVYKEHGTYYKFTIENGIPIKGEYSQGGIENYKPLAKDINTVYNRVSKVIEEVQPPVSIQDKLDQIDNSITLPSKKGPITIDTGKIKLNEQQSVALNKIADFINSDNTTFALKGYAGTGKTTIMEFLNNYINQVNPYQGVYFSSPTHRANAVLKQRIKNATVRTLHSLFGLSPEMDLEDFDAYKAKFKQQNAEKISNNSILIVDESSMINKELYKFIVEYSTKNKVKVIFVGDPKQLKPVKETNISIALSNSQESYELTKVERTGNNPLLEQATMLREDKPLTKVSKLNNKDEGVVFTSNPTEFLEQAVNLYKSSTFYENKLLLRVLAATNKRVEELNNYLRKGIYGTDIENDYNIGELLMGYDNFDVDPSTKEPIISNSGDYIIKQIERPIIKNISGIEVKGQYLVIQDLNIKDKVREHRVFTLSKSNNSDVFDKLGRTFEDLRQSSVMNAAAGMKGAWSAFYAFKKSFVTPIDIKYKGTIKIKKTIDYGYAHTIHKSQGGTYTYSFVDDNSIETGFAQDKETRQQLKYVGVTRASSKAIILTNNVKVNEDLHSPIIIDEEVELSPSNKTLISEQYRRIQLIDKDLNVLNQDRTPNNIKIISRLNAEKEVIEERIEDIKQISDVMQITALAEIDLSEAEKEIEGDLTSGDIHRIESKLSIWKHGIRELLTDSEAENEMMRNGNIKEGGDFKGYVFYQNWATELDDKLIKLRETYLRNWLKDNIGKDINFSDMWMKQKDIGALPANTLDISHTDNIIIQSIDKFIKENAIYEKDALRKTYLNIEHTYNKAKHSLESIKTPGSNLFDSFKQLTKNNKETGRLISPYSAEYYKTTSDLYYKATASNDKAAWKAYFEFKRKNEVIFDFRKLFQDDQIFIEYDKDNKPIVYTEQDKEDHINELKKNIGERGFNKLYSTLETKYQLYKEAYIAAKDRINSYTSLPDADKLREIDLWDKTNSPYWYAKLNTEFESIYSTYKGVIKNNKGWNYTFSIPIRLDEKGDKTGWYDDNFDKIDKDESLYNFHEMLTDLLAELDSYLPLNEQKSMQGNLIPTIKKSIYEIFTQDGMKEAGIGMLDQLMEQLTDKEASDVSFANINPETHKIEKDLRVTFLSNNQEEIDNLVKRKQIDYLTKTQTIANKEQIAIFKEEAIDEVSKNRSFDLPKIMKIYASLVHTYKYKAKVEDILKIADTIISKSIETQKNRNGDPITNANRGKIETKSESDSFKNMKSQWDYFIQNFYGQRYQKENVFKHTDKHYTSSEKATMEELNNQGKIIETLYSEGKISQHAYLTVKEEIENQLAKLGGVYVDSQIGREFLKFIQIKGMGWNMFSAFSNVGFGLVSNMVQSSDGRIFNGKELTKAYQLTMGSMLKNYTFNQIETPTAKKIRSLMDKWDLHGEMQNELYKRTEVSMINEKTKWMGPYSMQQRSEYMNQAPLMIASLMHTKFKKEDGTEYSMWEAFDENGNWNTESYGEEPKDKIVKQRLRIEQTIKRMHGNFYANSPLRVNDKFITTALRQFRTWMFEGFHARFGSEKYDSLLDLTVKGNYRTFWQSLTDAKSIGEQNSFNNALFTATQLCRKLVGLKTKFDDRFNEVDAANMRQTMTEILIYMTMTMLALALRAAANGDDDDKKKRDKFLLNYMLNFGNRLQTDITFYTSPMSFSALTQNAIPCATMIKDIYKWGQASGKLLIGDDTIKTGVYAGDSRFLRDTSALLPFFTQIRKTISTGIQEIKN